MIDFTLEAVHTIQSTCLVVSACEEHVTREEKFEQEKSCDDFDTPGSSVNEVFAIVQKSQQNIERQLRWIDNEGGEKGGKRQEWMLNWRWVDGEVGSFAGGGRDRL